MSYCCCSLAGTSACDHCANRSSEWSKPVYVINPPFTVDTTNFPPQEFVPVVRCKDCKYAEEEKTEHPYGVLCNHATVGGYGDVFDFMHYCSYGERREDDEAS